MLLVKNTYENCNVNIVGFLDKSFVISTYH
jgi:hypothetical protein